MIWLGLVAFVAMFALSAKLKTAEKELAAILWLIAFVLILHLA